MVGLISPTGKPKMLAAVHPNKGIELEYRRRLTALIDKMNASLAYFLAAAYRANPPELAQDKSPAAELNDAFKKLARRWDQRFRELAPTLAKWFATSAKDRSDGALHAALRKSGMTVRFQMTRPANDAYQAMISENVGLIRSIASEHLTDVQGLVMRSVSRGRDLGTLTKELEARYGLTRKRAAFIARDQNNKASAVIQAVRQRELGITQAIWLHSSGGRVPRPSHVKAGRERLVYDVTKGAFIDGAWIYPGELPNCRCVCRAVVRGLT